MSRRIQFQKYSFAVITLIFGVVPNLLCGQTIQNSLPAKATLSDCINYALANQPIIKQSKIDEDINRQNIRIALSGWLPQFNADANFQHNIKLPTSITPNLSNPGGPKLEVPVGLFNTSAIQLSASQIIYSPDLFYAGRTAHDLRSFSSQNTENSKIDLVVSVSKAFYDVLLTEQQLNVLNEDIQRLERNLKDAYSQYQSGLTDKTDFQRATIALNNAKAQKKSTLESSKVKYSFLKQLMGCTIDSPLKVSFDSTLMENEIVVDTLKPLDYNNRIEYQLLQTNLKLQNARVNYFKWSFLPSLSAFANDNFVYQNDQFSNLYNKAYPNSNIGLKLSLPIFQGTYRLQNIQKARLEFNRTQLDVDDLKNRMNTQYTQALAAYKSYMNELVSAKENIALAHDIFTTVKLQYDKGTKTYLEVIVSETDLRTAQLNYLNTLYQVLSSKLDVQRALGDISIK